MSSHDVFVCYSARDKTVATAICAVLEAEGVRCWMAPRDILPGADWGESIIDAINDAKAMVLVFSANANDAQQQIKREVERAVNKGMPVIPFRIENVLPTKALEYFLSTPHWLDAFTPPLDDHVRQLADSIKRLLGKQLEDRPLLTKTPPLMPRLPQHEQRPPIDLKNIHIGGVPVQDWIKVPKNAAIAGGVVLVLLVGFWFAFLRPTAKPEDQQAWNVAAMEDAIPGYQLYMREMPNGYYSGKAESRVTELKTEVDQAFAKAKAANTPAAYTNFLQTYAKQGVDLDEAREAYANADARENGVRIAYNSARQMRSRDGYQGFLTQYGTSTYAPDIRTRLAACHAQTQTTGGTQSSEISRSGTGTGNTPVIACTQARGVVTMEVQNACGASARLTNPRVVSQNVQNASSAGGQVVGSILGGALFGRNQNVNVGAVYQCTLVGAATCQKATSSSRQVDVCP